MILVDTSVWIDFFNGIATPETDFLDSTLSTEPVGIGDLILVEVLQGFRHDRDYRQARSLLTALSVFQLLDEQRAVRAADAFRALRRLGSTIRKTTDVIIGTYCIEQRLPLLYSDRDFDPMVEHLGLEAALVKPAGDEVR